MLRTVWLLESNLMWSTRLASRFRGLGWRAEVVRPDHTFPDSDSPAPDLAVVNLSEGAYFPLAEALRAAGVPLIAHAGHKEGELLAQGHALAADLVVTNREITDRLPALLARFPLGSK